MLELISFSIEIICPSHVSEPLDSQPLNVHPDPLHWVSKTAVCEKMGVFIQRRVQHKHWTLKKRVTNPCMYCTCILFYVYNYTLIILLFLWIEEKSWKWRSEIFFIKTPSWLCWVAFELVDGTTNMHSVQSVKMERYRTVQKCCLGFLW